MKRACLVRSWFACTYWTFVFAAFTLFLLSSAQVSQWTRQPTDPLFGVLGENVSFEWNFTLAGNDKIFDFRLEQWKDSNQKDIVTYQENGKVRVSAQFKGKFGLARDATHPVFILVNAETSDEAKYCCKVSTQDGYDDKNCINLQILVRPNITEISKNQTLNETNDVTLSCNATGKPPPNVTWSSLGNSDMKNSGSVLSLKNISRDQDGEYLCTASNKVGNATASVMVTVNYAPSITPNSTRYNFTEGNDISLRCDTDGRPLPTVTWTKIGKFSSVAYPDRQTLIITNANRTEAGTYRCTATNGIGHGASASILVNMFFPPSIHRGPVNKTVNESTEIVLFCNATGNPPPNITWTKLTDPAVQLSVDEVLKVKNVNKTDSGVYQCRASNGIGSDALASSTVTINYKPEGTRLTSDAHNDAVTANFQVTFYCTAVSVPPSELELRFDNSSLGLFINNKFTLKNVNASNQGTYECVPRNILGTGPAATLNLTVLVSPSIAKGPSNKTMNESTDLELFCNATGNPTPNITWSKVVDPPIQLSLDEVLKVKNINKTDSGVYQCRASNGIGSDAFASSTVTVNYIPEGTRLTSDAHNDAVKESFQVTFYCTAFSVPPSELEFRFDNSSLGLFINNKFTLKNVNASNQGTYECVPRNILGTGPPASLNLTVLVSASIDYISQNTTVNETDDVKLFCNSTGNPMPNITWTFLENSANVKFGNNLSLQQVNRSQAGTYQCTATNGVTSHAWADVRVQVNYKPEMKDGLSVIKSWINLETEVTCEAEGFPAPEIVWTRNGIVTSSTTLYSRVSTLQFTPQDKNEFGILLCTAKNLLGTARKNITVKQLVVPGAPEILQIDAGIDNMEIHWKVSAVDPDSPVVKYLVQVKEKDKSQQWMNCTRINLQKSSGSMSCVMNELNSGTEYIVRIAVRNAVGYSAFTVKQRSTKRRAEKKEEQEGLPGSTVDGIIAGLICFFAVIVVIVAIVKKRRSRSQGSNKETIVESSKMVTITSYDNQMTESEIPKTEAPQLIFNC